MNITEIIIIGLATWRIASMLVHEKGPLNLFERMRTWVGIELMRAGDSPEYYKAVPDTFLAQLLDCVWCCSVWVAMGWTALYYFLPALAVWVALPFAISTIAIAVHAVHAAIGAKE